MRLHQNPPGRGGKPRRVHWNYVGTEGGLKHAWSAHIAGPCHWFICHEVGRTKPCLSAITNGTLDCPWCAQLIEEKEIGYQPLYREMDGKPVMVVVHDYSREIVDRLKFHERVQVARGVGITDAVCVTSAAVQTPRYNSTLAERNKPADINESLVRMWKLAELTAYWLNQRACEVTATETPPVPPPKPGVRLRGNKEPFSPVMQAAAARAGIPPAADDQGNAIMDALRRTKERVEKVERNGKH